MNHVNKSFFGMLFLVFFIPLLLVSAVSAVYIPESPLNLEIAPGVFTHQSVIGFKLGTFDISNPERHMYAPALLHTSEVGNAVIMRGKYRDWEGGTPSVRDIRFHVVCVSYPYADSGGGTPVLRPIYGGRCPLVDWRGTDVTANPFIVELYLVNTNPGENDTPYSAATSGFDGQLFSLDTPYLLSSEFNPIFSLAMSLNPGADVGDYASGDGEAIYNSGSYIPTNGSSGPNVTPILGANSFTAGSGSTQGFFYGEGPLLPTFFFNFTQPTASFKLEDAYGSGRELVNQAHIEVQNGVTGQYYSQHLIFTDTSSAEDFQLFPVEGSSLPISYQLFLEGESEEINKGDIVLWPGLVSGLNSRNLYIGEIVASDVASLASGTYQGTIFVTITNPN